MNNMLTLIAGIKVVVVGGLTAAAAAAAAALPVVAAIKWRRIWPMPFSAEYLICRHVHTDGRTDGRTDGLTTI
jgi:hypothetical protein